ncbi:MAG: hypothetical protein JO359_01670 [Candidatus Eremiobacteraeota bacterium]|nr:hypothetical protein [Candidatus Eremiobacteraeota bacterium]
MNPLGVGMEADVATTTLSSSTPAAQPAARPKATFVEMLSATLSGAHDETPQAEHGEHAPIRAPSASNVEALTAASFEVSSLQLTNVLGKISASQRAFDRLRKNAYSAVPPVTPTGESVGIDDEA